MKIDTKTRIATGRLNLAQGGNIHDDNWRKLLEAVRATQTKGAAGGYCANALTPRMLQDAIVSAESDLARYGLATSRRKGARLVIDMRPSYSGTAKRFRQVRAGIATLERGQHSWFLTRLEGGLVELRDTPSDAVQLFVTPEQRVRITQNFWANTRIATLVTDTDREAVNREKERQARQLLGIEGGE